MYMQHFNSFHLIIFYYYYYCLFHYLVYIYCISSFCCVLILVLLNLFQLVAKTTFLKVYIFDCTYC